MFCTKQNLLSTVQSLVLELEASENLEKATIHIGRKDNGDRLLEVTTIDITERIEVAVKKATDEAFEGGKEHAEDEILGLLSYFGIGVTLGRLNALQESIENPKTGERK